MIQVLELPPHEWAAFSEDAHRAVFKEQMPKSQARMDFALLAVDPSQGEPLCYVTCRIIDEETLYWGYGGALPPSLGTPKSWACMNAFLAHCQGSGYHTIFTLVENTNKVMLKFYAKLGAIIIGVRHIDGATMLEHALELKGV